MGTSTTIEWTDATWNPVTGCTKISAGCDNCYAERFSERFRGVPGHPFENGFDLQLKPATTPVLRVAMAQRGVEILAGAETWFSSGGELVSCPLIK